MTDYALHCPKCGGHVKLQIVNNRLGTICSQCGRVTAPNSISVDDKNAENPLGGEND